MTPLDQLQGRIGHWFGDPALLVRALTHRSYANEHGTTDNERLEFLGDAVLQMAITLYLLERYPDRREGELSKIRARLVSRAALAEVARQLDLPELIRFDAGATKQGARHSDRLLANAFEAVLGAVHQDAGADRSRAVVLELVAVRAAAAADRVDAERDNPVNALQERIQGDSGITPRYRDLSTGGTPHAPVFRVEVAVDGTRLAVGTGSTKKAARRVAARAALRALEGEE